MKINNTLIREQLQVPLDRFYSLLDIQVPHKGWIRAIRNALGMSGRQLAKRIDITKQRVSFIEKQEIDGSVTFNTMKKTAESLNCVFVYALVPRDSLKEIVHTQAKLVASKRLSRASHTMDLEGQALSKNESDRILSTMIRDIVDKLPSNLWDEL